MIKSKDYNSAQIIEENKKLRSYIFGDKKLGIISTNSATRYLFKQDSEEFSSILPQKRRENNFRCGYSHHRQRSIYFPQGSAIETTLESLKNEENSSHIYNLSDADSVVYLGPDDCSSLNNTYREETDKNDFQISIVETAVGSILSIEKPSSSMQSKRIPSLGETATACYCRFCKRDVHTVIDFNSCYNSKLLKVISSFISCCNYPN